MSFSFLDLPVLLDFQNFYGVGHDPFLGIPLVPQFSDALDFVSVVVISV